MVISAGTTLGRYEVRSLIGAGGMGEVYLAQDTQLRRLVALKLLPQSFTQDEDRLRRFEQEAYSASALNHPNILTIYEIGHSDSTRFIAMEYVEGETLRHHLSRSHAQSGEALLSGSGQRLNEALDIATQIASALAASQAAGIAHRDVKPENIMLRRDGYVKLLDFGLAKLTEGPTTTDTEAPTRALVNTNPGAVMGTVNYMSPEQARGHAVDSRTDIWSLGVVLYEMITGRVPFEGPTPSHVIVSILEKEQPPLARYLSDVPEALEWIVTKAITKDRDDRYQTAREMLTDLRRLKQRLDVGAELERSIAPDASSPHITASGARGGSTLSGYGLNQRTTDLGAAPTVSSAEYIAQGIGRHKIGVGIGLLLLVAAVAAGAVLWSKLNTGVAHTFQKVRLSQLTSTGNATVATISPDGKYVVHVVNDGTLSSLWVRQVATSSNVQIVPPSEARYVGVTFSKDGNYVYYVVYEKNSPLGIVYQIPALGGSPRKVTQDVDTPITFSTDGKRFAWIRNFPQSGETALFVANSDGSNEQKIASRQRPKRFTAGTPIGPSWAPEGDVIACTVAGPDNGSDRHTVALVDLNSKTETDATAHRWSFVQQVVWAPHSKGMVVTAQEQQGGPNQLWYVNHPGGEVERITNDLNNYNGVSISANGDTLATVQSQTSSSVWLAPNNSADAAIKVTSGNNEGGNGLALMPDGRIVYTVFGAGKSDIFMVNADGSNQRQLTSNAALNALPYASPDGRYIFFTSTRTGSPHIWRMDSDGTNLKQITDGIAEISPVVTPDSKWIIFQNISDLRLWKVPVDGGQPVQIIDKLASQAAISPDGKLIACRYREEELSPFKLALIDFETGKTVKAIDIPPTNAILDWSADGRAVLYVDARGGVSNLWSQPIDGGTPKQLTSFKSDLIFAFDLSSDGKKLLLSRGSISNDVVLIADVQ
jgi:serine/threonine protein kinase/Tol biopolymer transport system component